MCNATNLITNKKCENVSQWFALIGTYKRGKLTKAENYTHNN